MILMKMAIMGRDLKLNSWFLIENIMYPSNHDDVKSSSSILGVLKGSAYWVLKYKFIRMVLIIKKEIEFE